MRPSHQVADILNEYESQWKEVLKLSSHQLRTLQALQQCRTATLGGHLDACKACGVIRVSYNSCRNRHCPKCQTVERERWLMAREAELLPVSYYHMVFTLPSTLNLLCLQHPKELYNLLFQCGWETVKAFADNEKHLGAKMAMTTILHTWGQNLSLHPHIHCLIPAGGMTKAGFWKDAKTTGKMTFPVKAMSQVFRGKFIEGLEQLGFLDASLKTLLYKHNWVVYAKKPFCNPEQIIEYLGRYSHKIAISNHRLTNVKGDKVTFKWKDYKDVSKQKQMVLSGVEFVRRFAQHVLPSGFTRIRHYGLAASRNKGTLLVEAGRLLGVMIRKLEKLPWQEIVLERFGFRPDICTECGKGIMIVVEEIKGGREPPKPWIFPKKQSK